MPALAILALAGCSRNPAEPEQRPPLAVEVYKVGAATSGSASAAGRDRRYPATLAYDRETTLGFRVSGIISAIGVETGTRLPRGAVVARLEDTPFRANLARATADLARIAHAVPRNRALLEAGATASADVQDGADALVAAQAMRTAAEYDLRSARLRMPFDGIVLTRVAAIGTAVGPGQPIVTVADRRAPLVARAQVPTPVAAMLRPGAAAQVTLAGANGALDGHVLRLAAATDSRSGTATITVAIAAPRGVFSGTVASVAFPALATIDAGASGERGDTSLRIPIQALVDVQAGRGHVFVVDDRTRRARRVPVNVVAIDDDYARVTRLAPGTLVVTSGAGYVADGQRVVTSG